VDVWGVMRDQQQSYPRAGLSKREEQYSRQDQYRRHQKDRDARVQHARTLELLRRCSAVTHHALGSDPMPVHISPSVAFVKYTVNTRTIQSRFKKCEYMATATTSRRRVSFATYVIQQTQAQVAAQCAPIRAR
jgi:hypothetical protein